MSITDVIKYEGNNQTFIWKHPSEDFNTGSQLIVHETQEAIFFLNGQALDSFGPGRHGSVEKVGVAPDPKRVGPASWNLEYG